ncbi:MAG: hypothetical protein KF858_02385 [Candidatus Sumerlaeia bacterium]|nr:hypothetical protein [Candidatus Sumerlaeia bacterium]
MRHVVSALALLLMALTLSGCVSRLGPGGAQPGLFYSDVTYPNELQPRMSHQIRFDRSDIELLESVHAEARSRWYFFVVSTGDSGYGRLMDQVRAQGGDGVMNVTIDTEYRNYFLFYATVRTKLSGVAYRYRR